jgi:hypothetical protein
MAQSLDHIHLVPEAEVKDLLGMDLRQDTWEYLVNNGFVARVQKRERPVEGWIA